MPDIILFGYPTSPYYGKLLLTLSFLQLPYKICAQPRMLPRPDFESVGITYRRIPLLSIDGHVYCDTSLIIDKLCGLANLPNHRETEVMGNAMFPYCAGLIPYDLIADPAFLKDRSALTGRPWQEREIKAGRPFALSQFTAFLEIISTILRNGGGHVRDPRVTMADVHLVFVVQWVLSGHRGAQPEVSPQTHPDIYAWVTSVNAAIKEKDRLGKAGKMSFDEAKKQLLAPKETNLSSLHNQQEPLGFKVGANVAVTPIDTGKTHPQVGQLQFMNAAEVCVKTHAGVLVSFPRLNYSIRPVKSTTKL